MSEDCHPSGYCETCHGRAQSLRDVPSGPVHMCMGCGGWLPGYNPAIPQNGDSIYCPTCGSVSKSTRKVIWTDTVNGRAGAACTDNWHWTGNQLVLYSSAPRGWEWNEGDDRYMRELDAAFAKPLEEFSL